MRAHLLRAASAGSITPLRPRRACRRLSAEKWQASAGIEELRLALARSCRLLVNNIRLLAVDAVIKQRIPFSSSILLWNRVVLPSLPLTPRSGGMKNGGQVNGGTTDGTVAMAGGGEYQ